jgi:hypothetical protein
MQILIFLNKVDVLIPIESSNTQWTKRFVIFLVMAPIFLLLTLIIKKKELERFKQGGIYEQNAIRKGNIGLIIYVIISFALLILLAIFIKRH